MQDIHGSIISLVFGKPRKTIFHIDTCDGSRRRGTHVLNNVIGMTRVSRRNERTKLPCQVTSYPYSCVPSPTGPLFISNTGPSYMRYSINWATLTGACAVNSRQIAERAPFSLILRCGLRKQIGALRRL